MYKGLINKYAKWLPVTEMTPEVTLLEGDTPLIPSLNLKNRLGVDLYFKYEGLNPTGSFKDRGMAMAVAKAMEDGSKTVICASTGNTSASAAAYAARYGLKCVVLIPSGNVALGKLAQAYMYGATVIQIKGNFDRALELVKEISRKHDMTLVNSLNPHRLEGQKTAAFEIVEQLGDAPDFLALPVGNAGNITAYWNGFKVMKEENISSKLPVMAGFQAKGASPMVSGAVFRDPQTIATAIRIGDPANREKAERAKRESGGFIKSVTDEEILKAYGLLASSEGVFAEPASAASLAGVMKSRESGLIPEGATVVCVLTGNGLKDPDTAVGTVEKPQAVEADEEKIMKIIGETK